MAACEERWFDQMCRRLGGKSWTANLQATRDYLPWLQRIILGTPVENTGSLSIAGHLPQIIVLFVSIFIVAFFTSSEASLISVNKFRIRH
ncbi:uncharacterized protein METZ01_LOCUS273414, partial [marine metagenome]